MGEGKQASDFSLSSRESSSDAIWCFYSRLLLLKVPRRSKWINIL